MNTQNRPHAGEVIQSHSFVAVHGIGQPLAQLVGVSAGRKNGGVTAHRTPDKRRDRINIRLQGWLRLVDLRIGKSKIRSQWVPLKPVNDPASGSSLLSIVRLQKTEYALVSSLQRDPLLANRIKRLRTVPGVGPITALTWALEMGELSRFPSIREAISYCGLCGDEKSSADKVIRYPTFQTAQQTYPTRAGGSREAGAQTGSYSGPGL